MNRETILGALFTTLTGGYATSLTGTVPGDSSHTIGSVSSFAGLFVGMPVVGPSIVERGTTILSMFQGASTVTLSGPAMAGGPYTFQTGFRTVGRRLKFANEVKEQPAMFVLSDDDDVSSRPTGMPGKVTLGARIWLYSNAGQNPDVAPGAALNYLIDAVETILNPYPQERQTLGGLVQHCWIEGQILKHPGDLDGQAIAVIPVKILVPSTH